MSVEVGCALSPPPEARQRPSACIRIATITLAAFVCAAPSHAVTLSPNTFYTRAEQTGMMEASPADDTALRVATPRLDSALARITRILDKVDFMYGIDWYRTNTEGNKTRSFKPSNVFQLHSVSAGYREKFGDVAFDFQSSLRWTNDFTITRSRDYKIQSIYGNFERAEKWALRVGDIFPNFSPYTFTRSARYGAHGWYKYPMLGGNLKLAGALGVTNRDQEFTGGTEAGQYRRWASGTSLDWEGDDGPGPIEKLTAGFRFSNARDDGSSITSRTGSGGTPIAKMDIDVASFRYEAGLPWGISWRGENAYSNGTRDMAAANPLHRYGTAHNTALDWRRPSAWGTPGTIARVLPASIRADYEWVDPDFLTELGSAAVDQMRWGVNTDHRWSDALDWTTSFIHNENNVKRRIQAGNVVINTSRTASFRMNMRPFELSSGLFTVPDHLRTIRYGFEFRRGEQSASNATSNSKNEDYNHSIDYKNWGINWNGDYKVQLRDDDIAATNDRRVDDWGIRASRMFTYSVWEVRITPTASYRHSVDGTLRGENLSRTQTANFGVGVSQGEFNLQTGFTLTDLDRNQRNNDSLNKTYTASLGFRPLFAPGLNMTLSFRHSDIDEENKSNSYKQTEGRAHVDYRF